MKVWLRILVSLFLIFISFALLQLLKSLPLAGEFLLVGSGITFGVGCILLLSTLLLVLQLTKEAKRKTEAITAEYVEKRLEEKTADIKPEYLEGKLMFDAGDLASYIKKRGVARGGLGETGTYKPYEELWYGIQRRARSILKEHPDLKNSYVLPLLEKVHPAYVGKVLEILAETTEVYKRINFTFIDKKGLKRLASIIGKYVKQTT